MKITLKEDWDIPVQPPGGDETGHFVGRVNEVSFLTNDLLRRSQGALLVSGYRGVGKTSLVYKALRSLPEKSILPVLINATHLESEVAVQEDIQYAKQVIINLIRRLYSACAPGGKWKVKPDIYENIEALYKKAVALEYKASVQALSTEGQKLETVKSFESSIFSDRLNVGTWTVSFALAAVITAIPMPAQLDWAKSLLTLLFAFPIPLGINLYRSSKRVETTVDTTKLTAEELYTLDNNVGNLVFDLEGIHRQLSKQKMKVIYVVDELDKLEDPIQAVKADKDPAYLTIFKHFKNFFTLSSALFVFIAGEEVYEHFDKTLDPKHPGLHRSKEYTYFNSKYFLSRPAETDTDRFLTEIVQDSDKISQGYEKEEFDQFKRYLAFLAQSDFYDLIQAIRDRITDFAGRRPVIDIVQLGGAELLRANLQKAVSVVYGDKYAARSPSRWRENERIIKELYVHANLLARSKLKATFEDDKTNTIEGAAKRDFNYFCYRHRLLDKHPKEPPLEVEGNTIAIRTYTFLGAFGAPIPDKLGFRSEIERNFVDTMQEVVDDIGYLQNLNLALTGTVLSLPTARAEASMQDILPFVASLTKWNVSLPAWEELRTKYAKLHDEEPPYPYNREEIEQATEKARQARTALADNSHTIIANMIVDGYASAQLQVGPLPQNENLFSGPLLGFRQDVIRLPHLVVFDKEFKRQILVTPSIARQILDAHKDSLWENSSNHMVILTAADEPGLGYRKGVLALAANPRKGAQRTVERLRIWLQGALVTPPEEAPD